MRNLATIQIIKNLEPILEADKIEKATVLGWECVVKKNIFKIGDKCIYIEIDSIVPDIPIFEFMRDRKFRVRTIKLRGQISQGLTLPISDFPEIKNLKEGLDITNILGITKYDPELQEENSQHHTSRYSPFVQKLLRYKFFRRIIKPKKGESGNWPTFLHKTDEERIQGCPHILEEYSNNLKSIYITEKIDGSSSSYFIYKKKFGVCSRNLRKLHASENDNFWKIAKKYDIEKKMKKAMKELGYKNIAIQGEIIGPNIQKNKYIVNNLYLYVYNVFDIDNDRYLDFYKFKEFCQISKLDTVPILYEGIDISGWNIPALVDFSKGNSCINPKTLREGIVI
jgi:hypothetical protein